MASITLNGTSFTPRDVQEDGDKVGKEIGPAANGARRFAHRANKRQWRLSWRRVLAATRTSVRGIFNLTASFIFVDEAGTSYTVYCPPGGFKSSVSLIAGAGPTLYYDVELTIKEAS